MLFDNTAEFVETIYQNRNKSNCGSLSVEGGEFINTYRMKLDTIPADVNVLVCSVFGAQDAIQATENLYFEFKSENGRSYCKFVLDRMEEQPFHVLAVISRKSVTEPNSWRIWAAGDPVDGESTEDLKNVSHRYADPWDITAIKSRRATETKDWKEVDVTVLSAKVIKAKKKLGTNPYVKIDVPKKGSIRTNIINDTVLPDFNFNFLIDRVDELKVELWVAKDMKNKLIGSSPLFISKLPMGDSTVEINVKGKLRKTGSVSLKILKF